MNKRSNGKMKYRMLSILGLVIFFGVWEAAVRLGWVSHRSLNAPSEVVETFIYKLTNANPDGSTLPQHFFQSLKLALTSFIIATIIGVPLGWIMGYYKVADFLLNPLFEIIRPIPPIAWIPIVILTMGIGMSAKVFIIFVAAFVPNVINSYLGIRLTDATLINVAKTFGASDWKIFTTVCIPSSMNMLIPERILDNTGSSRDACFHPWPWLHDPDGPYHYPSGHHYCWYVYDWFNRSHAQWNPGIV